MSLVVEKLVGPKIHISKVNNLRCNESSTKRWCGSGERGGSSTRVRVCRVKLMRGKRIKRTKIDVEGSRTPNCHLLKENTQEEKKFVRGNEEFEEQNMPFLTPIF